MFGGKYLEWKEKAARHKLTAFTRTLAFYTASYTRVLVILLRSRPRCSITEKTFTFRTTLHSRARDQGSQRPISTLSTLVILIFSIHLLYKNKNKERKNYLLFLDRPCFCFELYHLFSIDNCYCTTRSNRKTERPRYNCSKIKRTWRATRHSRGRGSSPAKRREGTFRSKANRSAPWSNVTRILRVVALTSKLADSRYRRYDYGSSSALLSKSLPLEKRNNKRKKPKSSPSPLPFIKKKN